MVERKILVITLLVVATIFSGAGYVVNQFLDPLEQNENTTITITETKTTTFISTSVISNTDLLFPDTDSPTLMVSSLFEDGQVLLTLSINGSVFHHGETVNLTATLSNLTPKNLTIQLIETYLTIHNRNNNEIWTPQISLWQSRGLRPPDEEYFNLKPFETTIISSASGLWNLTGLESVDSKTRYSDQFVIEDPYKVVWHSNVLTYPVTIQIIVRE